MVDRITRKTPELQTGAIYKPSINTQSYNSLPMDEKSGKSASISNVTSLLLLTA